MLTMDEARARVAKGVASLDKARPDWADCIDVGTLSMSGACLCIMGQLANGAAWEHAGFSLYQYPDLVPAVTLDDASTRTYRDDQFGTDYEERRRDYVVLQDAWIEAIAARRFPDSVASAPQSCDAVDPVAANVPQADHARLGVLKS